MKNFPIPTELGALLKRLRKEERELVRLLAEVEERIRCFEDRERPAYENWLRLELGPRLTLLEELYAQVHERRRFALRVNTLIEKHGLHPREALFVATTRVDSSVTESADPAEPPERGSADKNWDPEEIEARRQAKREAKRSERRANARAGRAEAGAESEDPRAASPQLSLRRKVVALYRALARRLHPDSPHALGDGRAPALWLEAQAAYDAVDLDRLLALSVWLGSSEGGASLETPGLAEPTIPERYERLRALGKSLAKMKKRVGDSSSHPAWGFGSPDGLNRKKLRKQAAREIEEEMSETQETLEALEDFVASIGPARPPREKPKRRGY